MKLKCLIISLLIIGTQVYSQNVGSKRLVIFTANIKQSSEKVNAFLQTYVTMIENSNEIGYQYRYTFTMPKSNLKELDSLAKSLGNITGDNYNMSNIENRIREKNSQIENLKYENELYSKLLKDTVSSGFKTSEITSKLSSNARQMVSLEVEIYKLQKELENNLVHVELELHDEQSVPEGTRIRLVNMPGLEYGYLFVENPKPGVSLKSYQGVNIKYILTRGKSYVNVGVYKGSSSLTADTSSVNELFVVNFGQDFYPRHFGRGKRKFLNLYTGYQVGGIILHQKNDKNTRSIMNGNISLGLELIKTKHILVDNKVSYFLPINSINHDLRGLLYQLSFNFVF